MGCVAGSRKAGVEGQDAQLKRASGTNMSHQASTRETLQNNSRRPRSLPYRRLATLLSLFVLLMTLLGTASAQNLHDRRRIRQSSAPLLATVPVQDLASWKDQGSLLVVDTRPPPDAPHLMHLRHRAEDATKTTSAPSSKRSIDTDPSAAPSNFKIPTPFDSALSNNYTTTCALFFQNLLTDSEFNDCHPFSLLLQTSSGFFDASKSYIRITQTLEATCKSNLSTCRNVMNTKARTLISKNHCGVDYENDNPQVLQAYNGLLAYEPLYKASCLQDQQGNFCYANAVTNATSPTDSYPYYLPLGVTLPGGARPTCNSCLQNAMAIFSSFADNSTQPISKTYNSAAQQIDVGCGPMFVNKTAVPLKGAASGTSATLLPSLTLLIIFFYFFQ